MRVDLFDFDLPPGLIAQEPAEPRDAARLLHVAPAGLRDLHVYDLPAALRPGDLLVVNDTRVLPARLRGRRDGGGAAGGGARVEVTLHKDLGGGRWRAFARPARKLRPGETVRFAADLAAGVEDRGEGGEVGLRFDRSGPALLDALHRYGVMPLPPYIRRPPEGRPEDREAYQTLFARVDGAVAAPTASLHFTPGLAAALEARGVGRAALTLHVGAGTFLPVKAADTSEHRMHAERFTLDAATAERINATRARGGRIVAVGTTVLRTLESVADPAGRVEARTGETDLFITPGYRFKAVDLLLTNFHLPRSTLFMLVAAFAGLERMRAAYAHAVAAGYRFYSYGDACLLEPAP